MVLCFTSHLEVPHPPTLIYYKYFAVVISKGHPSLEMILGEKKLGYTITFLLPKSPNFHMLGEVISWP
jgi:hypothetical protein